MQKPSHILDAETPLEAPSRVHRRNFLDQYGYDYPPSYEFGTSSSDIGADGTGTHEQLFAICIVSVDQF